jgi:hypothetical protein
MDGCDEHWMENWREHTREDPDPLHKISFRINIINITLLTQHMNELDFDFEVLICFLLFLSKTIINQVIDGENEENRELLLLKRTANYYFLKATSIIVGVMNYFHILIYNGPPIEKVHSRTSLI